MAKSAFQVSGAKQIANNILIQGNKMLARIVEATEKTAVDIENHAKANHVEGVAHSMGRFERKSGLLQKNIFNVVETANFQEVVVAIFAAMEYAPDVEFGDFGRRAYPFMFPALIANQENLKRRLAKAKV